MWENIRTRMIGVAEDIRRCGKESHPIFSRNEFLPATGEVVNKLLNHPLLVTTAELSQIFRLRRCDETTAPQQDVTRVYYIRTFPILRSQILNIIADWELSSRKYDTVPHWLSHLQSMKSEDSIVNIRYIGMTDGGKTTWTRFWDDIVSRKSGILAAFLHEIVNRYPEVMGNSQVHELWDASYRHLSHLKAPRGLLDDRERILIPFLNRNVLLNQQLGGFYHTYTLLASKHEILLSRWILQTV